MFLIKSELSHDFSQNSRMKTISTSISLALLAGTGNNHVHAFAPIAPQLQSSQMITREPARFAFQAMKLANHEENENPLVELKNPKPVLFSFFEKMAKDTNTKVTASALMVFALAFLPLNADAAMSGGRMGGSFSAPRQSISRPSPSSSFSRGYSRGYGSGYYSRPSTTIITPGLGYGYSPFGYSPFMSPVVPFGGAGVIPYARGPSFFDLLFIGGFLFTLTSIFSKSESVIESSSSTFGDIFDSAAATSLGSGTSVVQLSVAMEVPNRDDPNSILGVLDRLSQTARTDSRVGIQNLTSQVALELLRRRSSITSAASSYNHFRDETKAGREFQSRSVKERSKFEREVVSKYGGVDYSAKGGSKGSTGAKATMAVVTIILSIAGDSTKIPKINSISDVEEALRKMASDAKVDDCLQSAEILWTPEDRSETLSFGDVVADYPELRSI